MKTPQPRIKSLQTKITKGVLLLCLLFFGWVISLPPGGGIAKQSAQRRQCQSNLKEIMLGMKQYLQDYDGRFPLAATAKPTFGWAGALQPYLKTKQIFQCASEENTPASTPPKPSQLEYTDYWFNARASAVYQVQIDDPVFTIALGDGNAGSDATDAAYHLLSIPARWHKDEKSPLYRHRGGANYAFADGHVKWRNASSWKTEFDMDNGPTLRLKPRN